MSVEGVGLFRGSSALPSFWPGVSDVLPLLGIPGGQNGVNLDAGAGQTVPGVCVSVMCQRVSSFGLAPWVPFAARGGGSSPRG